jgi:hypothetical protein
MLKVAPPGKDDGKATSVRENPFMRSRTSLTDAVGYGGSI